MMSNKETISASEISRFTYCPYQWYYERVYGSAELRRLYKERNEALGLDSTAESNFRRGLDYHRDYGKTSLARKLLRVAAAAVLCAAAYLLYIYLIRISI